MHINGLARHMLFAQNFILQIKSDPLERNFIFIIYIRFLQIFISVNVG